jgi:hypothetical protein
MLTVQYLRALGACWDDDQLAEAAKSWPNRPTWSWFLGDRLAGMPRAQQVLRVHVAMAAAGRERLRVNASVVRYAKRCSDDVLPGVLTALGMLLDAKDDATRDARRADLERVLATPLPDAA